LAVSRPAVSQDPLHLRCVEKPYHRLRRDLDLDPELSSEKSLMVQHEFKLELDKKWTIVSYYSE
jgi:hypothetical protein